jgi:hypothetical protein
MKTVFAFFAALVLVAAVERPAHAAANISVDFFYDALAPYGDWVDVEGYGYCFRPTATLEDPTWRPYTEGAWIYTDAGWTWESDEDFGWATYHYGRWTLIQDQWLWVPGDVWAPAWVSWRADDDYVGWAPLPPEAVWSQDTGFTEYVDVTYDIGPAYYSFVPVHFLGERHLRRYIEPWRRNVDYMRRTHNYTRITHRNTGNHITAIFNEGPDFTRFARHTDHPIRRMDLAARADTDFRDPHRHFRNTAENDRFSVIAPAVSLAASAASRDGRSENRGPAPDKVKQHFDRTNVNHGWKGYREDEVTALRSEIKTESANRDTNRERGRDANRATATGDQPPKGTETRKGESANSERMTAEKNKARPGDKDEVRKAIPTGERDKEEMRKAIPATPGPNQPEERTRIRPDENQKRKMPLDPNRDPSKGPNKFRESPQDAPPRSQVGPRTGVIRPDDTPPGASRKMAPGEDSGNSKRPEHIQNPKMKTDREKQNDNPVPRAGVIRPDNNPPGPSRKIAPGEPNAGGNSQRPDRDSVPRMKPQKHEDPAPRVAPQQRVQPAPEPRRVEQPKQQPRVEVPKSSPPPALQKSDRGGKPSGSPGATKKSDDDDDKKKKH